MLATLRNHPKLKYRGTSSWPPQWGGAYDNLDAFPEHEDGILDGVKIVERDFIGPRRLELISRWHRNLVAGQIWLDDPTIVPRLYSLLKENEGHPISEIGSLEVDL